MVAKNSFGKTAISVTLSPSVVMRALQRRVLEEFVFQAPFDRGAEFDFLGAEFKFAPDHLALVGGGHGQFFRCRGFFALLEPAPPFVM